MAPRLDFSPNANPGPGGPPGGTGGSHKYPQWGVMLGHDAKTSKIIEAKNDAAKQHDINQGYLDWFTSKSAAGNFIHGQFQIPNPVGGLEGIGDFFARLTEANTWLRVGEFAVGGILLYIGLKGLFPNAVSTVTAPVKKAAKLAAVIPK